MPFGAAVDILWVAWRGRIDQNSLTQEGILRLVASRAAAPACLILLGLNPMDDDGKQDQDLAIAPVHLPCAIAET
jgi:hypothetical protein